MRPYAILLCLLAVLITGTAAAARTPGPAAAPDASLSGTDTDTERTMQGMIGAQSYDLIARWLRANPHRSLKLHLDSRGGKAMFGAKLYEAIGAHGGVSTAVGAGQSCLSACGYLWLAGATRVVTDGGFLGFHSAFCERQCDLRGVGFINQSLLDILARTEPGLAVLVSNTGAMISGNHLLALARREDGQWAVRTFMPPPDGQPP